VIQRDYKSEIFIVIRVYNLEVLMKNECKKVLVIDDDPAICQTMKDVLEINGYEVITANDGKDGINTLSSMKALPCIILLDLMMPGMNGWGFLDFQRASPEYSQVPVIICSAYENSAKSIGLKPIITKPVQLNHLLGTVKALCS
jgi:CheY-like chemotaxis protein